MRSSISARTTSRSTSGPEPAACERTSERCSCVALLDRDVPGGQRAEAGRDAVVRLGVVREPADHLAGAAHLDQRLLGQHDRRAVAGDAHDLVDGQRAGADGDGLQPGPRVGGGGGAVPASGYDAGIRAAGSSRGWWLRSCRPLERPGPPAQVRGRHTVSPGRGPRQYTIANGHPTTRHPRRRRVTMVSGARTGSGGAGGSVAATRAAYRPPAATSSSCVPASTSRPPSSTAIRSASRTVDSRWAMVMVVRPRASSSSARCSARSVVVSSAARRLVEHEHRRVAQDRAGHGQPLLLTTGEPVPASAHDRVEPVGQRGHQVGDLGRGQRRPQLAVGGGRPRQQQVVAHRGVHEVALLRHHAHDRGEHVGVEVAHVDAVDGHPTGIGVVQPREQPRHGRLARAGRPDERQRRAGRHRQREVGDGIPVGAGVAQRRRPRRARHRARMPGRAPPGAPARARRAPGRGTRTPGRTAPSTPPTGRRR